MLKKDLEEILKDIIHVLCHYDINKIRFPGNYIVDMLQDGNYMNGLALDDKREILIDKELAYEAMRETVIHEIIHCKHYLKGTLDGKEFKSVEENVDKEAKHIIKYLFGEQVQKRKDN